MERQDIDKQNATVVMTKTDALMEIRRVADSLNDYATTMDNSLVRLKSQRIIALLVEIDNIS
jgi:hypothetical protein